MTFTCSSCWEHSMKHPQFSRRLQIYSNFYFLASTFWQEVSVGQEIVSRGDLEAYLVTGAKSGTITRSLLALVAHWTGPKNQNQGWFYFESSSTFTSFVSIGYLGHDLRELEKNSFSFWPETNRFQLFKLRDYTEFPYSHMKLMQLASLRLRSSRLILVEDQRGSQATQASY